MPFDIEQLRNITFWNNTLFDYSVALVAFLIALILLYAFKFILLQQLSRISKKTKSNLDDLVIKSIDLIGWPFYCVLSLYFALQFIALPELVSKIAYYAFIVVATWYGIKFLQQMVDIGAHQIAKKRHKDEAEANGSMVHLLARIFKGTLWGIAVILILSNLGYDVSALLAGLGIGGIAVAFALQNVLSDIFASFSIYFDKPFKIGDFIIIGDDMGVVKKIGVKSTILESLWGEDIIVSNRELTTIRIHNYRQMKKRRVSFNFGVLYETPKKRVEKIPAIVKEIFKKVRGADLNRVHFKKFGDSSLDFEVVYYVDTGDYNKYMDIQQQINFMLKERMEKEKIDFAYPTRTVYMKK